MYSNSFGFVDKSCMTSYGVKAFVIDYYCLNTSSIIQNASRCSDFFKHATSEESLYIKFFC